MAIKIFIYAATTRAPSSTIIPIFTGIPALGEAWITMVSERFGKRGLMTMRQNISVLATADEVKEIESALNSLGEDLTILEAGCGRRWPLSLAVTHRVVGIDVDREAIRIRKKRAREVDEYHVGNLQDVQFPPGRFDAIYSSYVLEHVEQAGRVLENFANWLKPGGIIVLRVPDQRSVYGFLAKNTPHGLHILARRWLLGDRTAGLPGHGPFPVVYDHAMSKEALLRFAGTHGMDATVIATAYHIEKRPWLGPVTALFSLMCLGLLHWRHANLTFILHRPATTPNSDTA